MRRDGSFLPSIQSQKTLILTRTELVEVLVLQTHRPDRPTTWSNIAGHCKIAVNEYDTEKYDLSLV